MFEDSLLESEGRLVSKNRRWITVGSIGLQCLVAAAIVIVPMVKPEALPFTTMAAAVFVPLKKPPVIVKATVTRAVSSMASAPAPETLRQPMLQGRAFESRISFGEPAPPVSNIGMTAMVGNGGDPLGLPNGSVARVVVAKPEHIGPVKVSSGVSSGMLIGEIRPVYPRIAIVSRTEGIVVVEATISKTGAIESAHVISGPAMLAGAAIDAVRAARYHPYRLNGELTEVQTTVTVNFKLGS